jgi:hypothetical protein
MKKLGFVFLLGATISIIALPWTVTTFQALISGAVIGFGINCFKK